MIGRPIPSRKQDLCTAKYLFLPFVFVMACGPAGHSPDAATGGTNQERLRERTVPAAPAKMPHVVVSIVVDQFAAWIAHERLPELPSDGGFARLRREGTWVEQLRYAHAVTDTAPGHAALYTGATPSVS